MPVDSIRSNGIKAININGVNGDMGHAAQSKILLIMASQRLVNRFKQIDFCKNRSFIVSKDVKNGIQKISASLRMIPETILRNKSATEIYCHFANAE